MVMPELQFQEFVQTLEAEQDKTSTRYQQLLKHFAVDPSQPPMGQTPKEVMWKSGKSQLFHYIPRETGVHPTPFLIVPWLGISRTTILDMMPGASLVEFLVKQGYDTYLLDWGEIAEEDKDLGFDAAVSTIIPTAIARALATSGAKSLTLNGICLGGTMCASYLAITKNAPVRNFVTIVSPIDFDHAGMFKTWLGESDFPVDLLIEQYGGVPAHMMAQGFKMLRPTLEVDAFTGLWQNLDRPSYVTTFKAMKSWADDYIGMPGAFLGQLVKDLYQANKLVKGEFKVSGKRVDLAKIRQPLFVAAAKQDYISPAASCQALMGLVSSAEKEYMELPGGHISVFSGRQAHATLWPALDGWLKPRSQ